jgi:phage tail-like protein
VLELGDVEVAGFAECSGLQIETKVFEYQEGGNNATSLKFPERATFSNITLKRGVTNSTELIDWQMDVANGTFSINHRDMNNNVAIVLQDELGEPVKRWNLIRAFPVKWIGPSMKASSAEVAIETLELAHEGIQT